MKTPHFLDMHEDESSVAILSTFISFANILISTIK